MKYICSDFAGKLLLHTYHSKQAAAGIETVSLQRLLLNKETQSEAVSVLKLMKQLNAKKASFPIFCSMFRYPSFIQQILKFAEELTLLGLSCDNAVSENTRDQEMINLLKEASVFCTDADEKRRNAQALLESEEAKEYTYALYASADLFSQLFYKQMTARCGILQQTNTQPKQYVRHASSVRKEIESCLQNILKTGNASNIILCSPSSQLPVLKSVFSRYKLPFSCAVNTESVRLPSAFEALVRFGLIQDRSSLAKAAVSGCFSCTLDEMTAKWFAASGTTLPYKPIADEYAAYVKLGEGRQDDPAYRESDDILYVRDAEQKYLSWQNSAEQEIQYMLNCSPSDLLRHAFEIISHSELLKNPNEYRAGRALRKNLINALEEIETAEDVTNFLELIHTDQISSPVLLNDFIMVTDLLHPVTVKKDTYILGCTGTAYPGMPVRKDLFDETWIQRVPGYPSLMERDSLYRSQIEWIHGSTENSVYYSYSSNDYRGREILPAYEITELGKDLPWDFAENEVYYNRNHVLSAETSHDLFFRNKDGKEFIRGSVSSIENWFSCPYKGFISSGLYVRKKQIPGLDAATIGTQQHAVMEKAMLRYGDHYAVKLTPDVIEEFLTPCFNALKLLDQNHSFLLDLSFRRLSASIQESARVLAGFAESTSLRPFKPEQHFDKYHIVEKVQLNGTVDRIDYDPVSHTMAIIDYKSSTKTLSAKKAAEGLQLQLLSYLLNVIDDASGPDDPDLKPGGAYYFSMKDEYESDFPAMFVNRRSFRIFENDVRNPKYSNPQNGPLRTLKGFTLTDDIDVLDQQHLYIAQLNKIYAIDEIRSCMTDVYRYFADMLSGRSTEPAEEDDCKGPEGILCEPVSSACMFCDYHGICRFHGEFRKPAAVSDHVPASRKVGKEK